MQMFERQRGRYDLAASRPMGVSETDGDIVCAPASVNQIIGAEQLT